MRSFLTFFSSNAALVFGVFFAVSCRPSSFNFGRLQCCLILACSLCTTLVSSESLLLPVGLVAGCFFYPMNLVQARRVLAVLSTFSLVSCCAWESFTFSMVIRRGLKEGSWMSVFSLLLRRCFGKQPLGNPDRFHDLRWDWERRTSYNDVQNI